MHSPARLTLPLMVQSGDGATGPEADASRIVEAFSGGFAAPKKIVDRPPQHADHFRPQ